MTYNPPTNPRSFEEDGRFFAGYVQRAGTSNRKGRRRVLCFITNSGVFAASASFSRADAYHTAIRAAQNTLPTPHPGPNPAATIVNILKLRGYPVTNSYDGVDELTAEALERELNMRAAQNTQPLLQHA